MAGDLIRSFEKIDVNSYLPELPDIVKNAYGQDDVNKLMTMLGGMMNGQGGGAGMAGFNQEPSMEAVPAAMPGAAGQGAIPSPGAMQGAGVG